MAKNDNKHEVVARLLDRFGQTYSAELGIDIAKNTPSPLFMLLCAALMYSTRIRAELASEALRALFAQGWTTPQKMADTTWEERVKVLNENHYARYDESTSSRLGDMAELVLSKYDGDLRKLREAAERTPSKERRLIKEVNGVGDVGVDIFFREAQVAWPELYPFADKAALSAARRLGLGESVEDLAKLTGQDEFVRLVAALVRVQLSGAYDDITDAAQASS